MERMREAIDRISLKDSNGTASVKRFLNRILLLPDGEQNALFAFFAAELEGIIKEQRQAGTFDEGASVVRGSRDSAVGCGLLRLPCFSPEVLAS